SRADQAIVRNHDQAIDLLVAGIRERKYRPVVAALTGAELDAMHGAVGARRGLDQDAIGLGTFQLDRLGQIDRGGIRTDIHGLDTTGGRRARKSSQKTCHNEDGAQKAQIETLRIRDPRQSHPPDEYLGGKASARVPMWINTTNTMTPHQSGSAVRIPI